MIGVALSRVCVILRCKGHASLSFIGVDGVPLGETLFSGGNWSQLAVVRTLVHLVKALENDAHDKSEYEEGNDEYDRLCHVYKVRWF